jgi:hypothetical protein
MTCRADTKPVGCHSQRARKLRKPQPSLEFYSFSFSVCKQLECRLTFRANADFGLSVKTNCRQGIFLDRSAVSRIEGQTRYVTDCEAAAITRALKVSLVSLFGRDV